jgi:hypothetical protein
MRNNITIIFMLLSLAVLAFPGFGQDWNAYAEAWLAGEPHELGGEPYYSGAMGSYFQEITSGFAEPFFRPEFNISEATYYPYFGEEFFRSGYNPSEASQRAIEARRQKFESPYIDLFGESFFGKGEPYQSYQGNNAGIPKIAQIFPMIPYYFQPILSEWRQSNLAGRSWPYHENLTSNLGYARNRSSFRVYSGGIWS